MSNPVTWFEIIGKDAIKLQKFYRDVFSWKLSPPEPKMGNYSVLDNEGRGIAGGVGGAMEGPARVSVYIEVDDPQVYMDKATRAGGKMLMPVTHIMDGMVTFAMFADPEGNMIGLMKSRPS
jgi:predicted enzyme related to lactoylglutathione lyase